MIKRLIIALALGTGILFTANAQNSAVKDSLLRIYVTAPHDSMRLDVLHTSPAWTSRHRYSSIMRINC